MYNNSSYNLDDFAYSLAVDGNNGYTYVCGYTTVNTGGQGENGLLLCYNTTGTLVWATPYDHLGNNDWWTSIAIKQTSSSSILFVGGSSVISTSPMNINYMLGAYLASSGNLYSSWTTNPVFYQGGGTPPDPAGTNEGWAVSYEPTTDRIYIAGRSWETVANGKINITTLGYAATNGSLVWSASYDYNSDNIVAADRIFYKYILRTDYSSGYCVDDVYLVGESYVQNDGYDYITLKYDCPGCMNCNDDGQGDKHANTNNDVQIGLYPNPFSSEAVLNISSDNILSNASLNIYNITGKVVRSQININTNTITIKKENLPQGIYFYQLLNSDEIISSGKFIISD